MAAKRKALIQASALPQVDRATGVLLEKFTYEGFTFYPPSPNARPDRRYHRVVWYDSTGERRTNTVGKTFAEANASAAQKAAELEAGATLTDRTVEELINYYLMPARRRGRRREPWSEGTLRGYQWLAKKWVEPTIGKVRCRDLTATIMRERVLGQMRTVKDREGNTVRVPLTDDTRDRVEALLRRMVADGYERGYFERTPQKILRGLRADDVTDNLGSRAVREQGFSIIRVDPAEIPSHQMVADLASAFAGLSNTRPWYELMVYTAAYSGLRIGELLGLEKQFVSINPKRKIRVEWQLADNGSSGRKARPKRNKVRTTLFPERTPPTKQYPEGYPLAAKLHERLQDLPTGEMLLFTGPRGGRVGRSNFYSRILGPAAVVADWPHDEDGELTRKWHSLRHVFCTYYLWERPGFTPADVANMAGHSSVAVTLNLYGSAPTADRLDHLEG